MPIKKSKKARQLVLPDVKIREYYLDMKTNSRGCLQAAWKSIFMHTEIIGDINVRR
jgi:hypothetical protein